MSGLHPDGDALGLRTDRRCRRWCCPVIVSAFAAGALLVASYDAFEEAKKTDGPVIKAVLLLIGAFVAIAGLVIFCVLMTGSSEFFCPASGPRPPRSPPPDGDDDEEETSLDQGTSRDQGASGMSQTPSNTRSLRTKEVALVTCYETDECKEVLKQHTPTDQKPTPSPVETLVDSASLMCSLFPAFDSIESGQVPVLPFCQLDGKCATPTLAAPLPPPSMPAVATPVIGPLPSSTPNLAPSLQPVCGEARPDATDGRSWMHQVVASTSPSIPRPTSLL